MSTEILDPYADTNNWQADRIHEVLAVYDSNWDLSDDVSVTLALSDMVIDIFQLADRVWVTHRIFQRRDGTWQHAKIPFSPEKMIEQARAHYEIELRECDP